MSSLACRLVGIFGTIGRFLFTTIVERVSQLAGILLYRDIANGGFNYLNRNNQQRNIGVRDV